MVKCAGESAYDFEAVFFPKMNGGLVGADDEVELHGAIACGFGEMKRMLAHGVGDAAALLLWVCDVAAVADVGAGALLIGTEIVGADD